MPVTYQIDSTRHVIHTVCSRPLTFAQVIDHFRELSEDPACSGRLDVLLDVTAVDLVPNSSQIGAVGTALSAVRKKVEFGACAIIAAQRRHVWHDADLRGPGGRLFRSNPRISEERRCRSVARLAASRGRDGRVRLPAGYSAAQN